MGNRVQPERRDLVEQVDPHAIGDRYFDVIRVADHEASIWGHRCGTVIPVRRSRDA